MPMIARVAIGWPGFTPAFLDMIARIIPNTPQISPVGELVPLINETGR